MHFKSDVGSSPLRYNQLLCGRPHWGAWRKKMEKLFSMIIVAFVFTFIIFTKDGNETLGKYKSSVGNIGKCDRGEILA